MNSISFPIINWWLPSFWIYVLSFNQIQMVVIHTQSILYGYFLHLDTHAVVAGNAFALLDCFVICQDFIDCLLCLCIASLQTINKTGTWPECKKLKNWTYHHWNTGWHVSKLHYLTFQWQFISYHVVSQENMINMFFPWICMNLSCFVISIHLPSGSIILWMVQKSG